MTQFSLNFRPFLDWQVVLIGWSYIIQTSIGDKADPEAHYAILENPTINHNFAGFFFYPAPS